MSSSLEQLRRYTIVVADTGDFASLAKFKPQDSTTNPSLIYAASLLPQYQHLVNDAIEYARKKSNCPHKQLELATDKLAVNFGIEILKIVPGRVSTEIDARLSFNTEATVKKALEIIQLYKDAGIDTEKRILVKIASTWEGLQAAKILEQQNIHTNLTLLFSLTQAAVAGEVGVTLISPFAGRITDFYKEKSKRADPYPPSEDPGVLSVVNIYNYLKKFGYKTVVMGASFRTPEQVIELAGCDLLTVSPQILEKLANSKVPVSRKLDPQSAGTKSPYKEKIIYDQKSFLWALNQDEMAHFKLAEGIRKFTEDIVKLEAELVKKLKTQAKL